MEERKGRGGQSKGHDGPRPKQVAKVVEAPVHDNQTNVSNMMKVMMERMEKLEEMMKAHIGQSVTKPAA